jgi:catechol-2,3-dioxygenase
VSSRGLSELVLIVADVPTAARFYEDVVGLTPMPDGLVLGGAA